ncbi:MAG: ABC transporter substrate-binding protein [Burkholderiaceae bacterium]
MQRQIGNRVGKLALCAVLGLACGGVLAQAGAYSNGGVKIGVLTDMSGVYSDVGGVGSVVAAQMAIDDFKAEAKPAFKIDLVSADHQNKADIGASRVREWYDAEGVDMVTDLINSAVALAAAKVTVDKNRILMVSGAGTTRLTNEDCAPDNVVHYGWDTRSLSNGQALALAARGKKTWYFVSVDYALGRALEQEASEAIRAAGGRVLGSVKHPLNAADFSAFMLQAQSSKAQVIGLANGGGDLINAIKAAGEYGLRGKQTLAGLGTTFTDIHAIGLETAQGMFLVEDFYWDLNQQTRAWSRRFLAQHKRMPNMIHAATYSAVLSYLKAVQAAGTDAAPAVMKQLHALPINDMFVTNGAVRADGRMLHNMYVMEVKTPAESKEPWDYFHVRSTIPADKAFPPLSASKCSAVAK